MTVCLLVVVVVVIVVVWLLMTVVVELLNCGLPLLYALNVLDVVADCRLLPCLLLACVSINGKASLQLSFAAWMQC